MASNTQLNSGTGGDIVATKERTHDGDATKVQVVTLAGVSGTEGSYTFGDIGGDAANGLDVDVTRLPAIPAGNNNIGDVDIASIAAGDNNIGNVDVVTLPALPAGTNAIGTVTAVGAAAEDAAASGNPVLIGGRYDSSARTLETGDAGAIALNASGQVLVEIAAGAGSGGTAAADDADFTAGTTSGTPMMGSYQSSVTAVTDGDMGIVGITANREVKVAVSSGGIAGKAVDSVAGGTDEGVVTVAVRDDTLATLTPADGDYTTQRTNARGALWVALDSTAAQTVTLAAGTATNEVVGDAAHDAAAAGNPILNGGYASAAAPSDVSADGDAVRQWHLRNGSQVVNIAAGGALIGATSNALDVNIKSGGGSGGTSATDDAAFTAASGSGTPIMGFATADAVDSGDVGVVAMTTARALHTAVQSIAAGNNNIGDVDVASVPADPFGANADAASATGSISAKLRFIAGTGIPITGTVTVGSHAVTNAGTFATQVDGAALTALQLIDDPVIADDAAFTPATSKVMMAGFEADETATDSVDEGDAGAARMTLDRKQIVTLQPHTQGGLSIFRSLDIDETEEDVKTSAGQLYWIHAMNMVATARYLKFYNATAANVTVGSTTPVLTIPIPANSTTGAGFTVSIPQGLEFSTAISVACTTGVADADTGAPGTNDVIINLGYK